MFMKILVLRLQPKGATSSRKLMEAIAVKPRGSRMISSYPFGTIRCIQDPQPTFARVRLLRNVFRRVEADGYQQPTPRSHGCTFSQSQGGSSRCNLTTLQGAVTSAFRESVRNHDKLKPTNSMISLSHSMRTAEALNIGGDGHPLC